jgi:hypothetical protein
MHRLKGAVRESWCARDVLAIRERDTYLYLSTPSFVLPQFESLGCSHLLMV